MQPVRYKIEYTHKGVRHEIPYYGYGAPGEVDNAVTTYLSMGHFGYTFVFGFETEPSRWERL